MTNTIYDQKNEERKSVIVLISVMVGMIAIAILMWFVRTHFL